MATKKSSSKAKTKTAKTKATPKTATVSKTPVKIKREVTFPRLRSLHTLSAGVFILLALATGMLMSNQSYQVTAGYLTEDTLTKAIVPATRVWFDVEARWLVVAIMVLSAVWPVLYLTRLAKSYEKRMTEGRFQPWRWADFALTGALMLMTLSLMSGMQDYKALKLVGWLVIVAFWLAGIVEWRSKLQNPAWKTYLVAVAAITFPVLGVAEYAVNTIVYGSISSPWYVYALYAVVLAAFFSIFCIQYTDLRGKLAAWKNYLIVERNYIAVNLLTKTLFAVVLILGLLQ